MHVNATLVNKEHDVLTNADHDFTRVDFHQDDSNVVLRGNGIGMDTACNLKSTGIFALEIAEPTGGSPGAWDITQPHDTGDLFGNGLYNKVVGALVSMHTVASFDLSIERKRKIARI